MAPTREQIEAELARIDAELASETPRDMYTLTTLEASQTALTWVLGQRDTKPTSFLED